ncbi:MAG TPA: SDR family NAD(P)-dependent oxidoreductase [Chitinophagaceae bacterium]|nr:SDR family NAD(P)-dependent oxidoreductase [Chitinophagaceae bacterium]
MPNNNRTAIITGASEGLGKSFAIELAHRNCNVVLVALPQSGLPQLAALIEKNFSVRVIYFEMDLTKTESCILLFESLKLQKITTDILINNAGLGNWAWFEEKSLSFYRTQIELNIITPVLLTRLFLAQVNKATKSYLMNVGSLGGLFIMPRKQVYGATKSFIRYFTNCLRMELSNSNTSVTLLSPGGINTKPELLVLNHSIKGISRFTILEPEKVAKAALKGMLKGKKEIIPGWLNRQLVTLNKILPASVKEYIIQKQVKNMFTPR